MGRILRAASSAHLASRWAVRDGSFPPNQVQQDFDAIGRITGGLEPPPRTAANCPNPTVDGQLPLPSG
jgi:hypothetical protein